MLALGAWSCGRNHPLEDGPYQFTLKEVLRDDCDLAHATGVFSTGTLNTTGNIVSLSYGFLGVKLFGTYLSGIEQMTLDGTANNVSTPVRGNECLLDSVAVHLDTVTRSPTRFDGAMSITFDARSPDACVCKFWFNYEATRAGP